MLTLVAILNDTLYGAYVSLWVIPEKVMINFHMVCFESCLKHIAPRALSSYIQLSASLSSGVITISMSYWAVSLS